jgi:hypothetical protein
MDFCATTAYYLGFVYRGWGVELANFEGVNDNAKSQRHKTTTFCGGHAPAACGHFGTNVGGH